MQSTTAKPALRGRDPERCSVTSKPRSGRSAAAAEDLFSATRQVGKSFRLFDEGRRRHERGEDVVVALRSPLAPEVANVCRASKGFPGRRRRPGDRCRLFSPASAGLPRRRPGLRQPARSRQPKTHEDVGSCQRGIFNHHVDQPRVTSTTSRSRFESVLGRTSPVRSQTTSSVAPTKVVIVDAPPEAEHGHPRTTVSALRQRGLLSNADVVDTARVPPVARCSILLGDAGTDSRVH